MLVIEAVAEWFVSNAGTEVGLQLSHVHEPIRKPQLWMFIRPPIWGTLGSAPLGGGVTNPLKYVIPVICVTTPNSVILRQSIRA